MKKAILIGFISFMMISLLSPQGSISYEAPEVVYKDARAKKDLQETPKGTDYFYDPKDKTDPFAPFIVKMEKTLSQLEKEATSDQLLKVLAMLRELKTPKTELQRIEISALILTAIVRAEGKVMAMVRGPDKSRGYVIEKGTYVGTNGGVVEEIVSEEKQTALGKQLIRRVVVKEPYLDEKGTLKYKMIEMKMPGSSFE
ncbi:MAG: pilus assembly protein PilP [Pseudomonadota bacterium]